MTGTDGETAVPSEPGESAVPSEPGEPAAPGGETPSAVPEATAAVMPESAPAPGTRPVVGLTAEERGDTVGRGRRALVRVVVAVVILGGIAATIVVANGIPARVSGFVNQVAAGVLGGAATAIPSPGASGPAATPAATPSPTPTAEPISGDEQYIATMNGNESAARPSSTLAPYPVDADAKHQSDLVAANDARWSLIARGLGIDTGSTDKVFVLAGLDRPWTLADLVANGAVRQLDDTTYLMTKTVFVSSGSTLDLNAPGVTLRLSSGASGYTPLVAWGGAISFAGTAEAPLTITSWDTAADAADTDVTDGRAYVRIHEGTVTTSHTDFSDLGFWSGRTGGFALTGSSILLSTGTIDSTTFSGMHIGLYLDAAEKVAITGTSIRDSLEEGIELGDGVIGTTITDTSVVGSATNGIDVRKGSDDLTVTGATLSRNGGYGLRFDGAPRADAANSSGFSVDNSWGLTVADSTIGDNGSGAISVIGTSQVELRGNTVDQKTVGFLLRDSQAEITGNTVAVTPGNGIVFDGALSSARVAGNTISGEGPNAIALSNGADDVVRADNDDSGWTERWEVLVWIEAHPLALLWGLLLIIPIVGIAFVFYRVRRQRKIRELVESATIAVAAAEKASYEGARGMAAPDVAGVAEGEVPASAAAPSPLPAPAPAPKRSPAPKPARAASVTRAAAAPAPPSVVRAMPVKSQRPIDARAPQSSSGPGAASTSSSAEPAFGRFASVEELAVAAVLDAGKPIDRVAHALRVPVGSVAGWVSKARRQREAAEREAADRDR
ncbi:MAG: hypothetical protein EPO52_15695 [Herbiconiux sp.]|uniref:right-handed parallel beta-helix repeat-containing protein n=1 Tax=Herbiconiux sp. TaxID=1871186 RepID=UPI001218C0CC|nr:right-handed parallel beta-helix repeat-containing protein [Herbiconiux sp.]TAJ46455.1 MAG: hypothetical protein EPO52_15695 [Herbiconiux sp.]